MKKYLVILIVALFSLLASYNVKAASFTDNQVVDQNKKWTINFNEEVELNDYVRENIYVKDSNGNIVNTNLEMGQDNKSIIVDCPNGGYDVGKSYTLNITDKMKSKSENFIKTSISMNFNIEDNIVSFKDKNLEKVVRETLQKESGTIYKSDVLKITYLSAIDDGITDLSGIENLTNLQSLFLGGNPISDLSPLKDIKALSTLNLAGCQIDDVAPLENLDNLQQLYLSDNEIKDISSLKGLSNLQYLYIDGNQISNVDTILNLSKLCNLSVEGNPIEDTTPLKKVYNQLKVKDFILDSSGEISFE